MILKNQTAILAAFVLLLCTVSAPARAADDWLSPDIQSLLALPEDKIDIGMAALIFAHDLFPDHVNVLAYSRELDRLADEVRSLLPPNAGPNDTLRALATVIYQREGYRYDFSEGAWDKGANYVLPGILDTKRGTCVTLPMLFMAVAQHLGLAVYPVRAPQHNFLRITDPRASIRNIEATSGGTKSDANYIEDFQISDAAVANGTYMRTLTYHEYLANLLAINGQFYQHAHLYDRAIKYYEKAEQINPGFDYPLVSLMGIYLNKTFDSQVSDPIFRPWADDLGHAAIYLTTAQQYNDRMTELGVKWTDYFPEDALTAENSHDDEILYTN